MFYMPNELPRMTAREAMGRVLMQMLNASLVRQGFTDLEVVELSADFRRAKMVHVRDGRVACTGWVFAEALLDDVEAPRN